MKKLALIVLSLGFFWSCSSQTEKATSSKNYEDIKQWKTVPTYKR